MGFLWESASGSINKYGYEAVSNLGVSGVFIDLAVKS